MQSKQVVLESAAEIFLRLVETFSELASREGVEILPYGSSGLKHFLLLPEPLQHATNHHFGEYVAVAKQIHANSESLASDQVFLWRMFQRLKAHPAGDFMGSLKQGEVIEIHNPEFVQIYRNLHFFTLCSYTLDDLLCRPFWQLYERDASIENRLIEVATGIFSGMGGGTRSLDIPEHTVLEIDSPGRLMVRVQHRVASAVSLADGTPIAVVAAVKAHSCVRTAVSEQKEGKLWRGLLE